MQKMIANICCSNKHDYCKNQIVLNKIVFLLHKLHKNIVLMYYVLCTTCVYRTYVRYYILVLVLVLHSIAEWLVGSVSRSI